MQLGFFDIDRRHAMLNAQGDPLERLNKVIDWGIFRFVLGRIDAKAHKSNAGRKPTDRVSMFKLLILQRIYNLLIRPDEVLSRISDVPILKVANHPLRRLLQHCHVLSGRLA
jgi:hypothetical protein